MPSILHINKETSNICDSFKPCYKWNAFNTKEHGVILDDSTEVLNLVINGMPSILINFWGKRRC